MRLEDVIWQLGCMMRGERGDFRDPQDLLDIFFEHAAEEGKQRALACLSQGK